MNLLRAYFFLLKMAENIYMRKVNGCLKGIDLENIFQNLLWEKNLIKFLIIFYISHKGSINFFLK